MTKHIREVASSSIENISRRGILKGLLSTTGLVLAVSVLPARPARADEPKWGADGMPHGTVNNPLAFVSIAPDGTVTIVCHRSEMGQGVRTGMPLIVADELEADWSRVKVAQAPGDEVKFGNQDTDGSRSTRHFFLPMRQVGAAARMMLEQAAAKRWGVPVSDVEAKNHEVIQKSTGKKLGYGDLAADASTMGVPANVSQEKMGSATPVSLRLKDPSEFRYIGKEGTNIVDGFDITTGRANYGQDVRLPGTKYAVVARPPVMGGKVASLRCHGREEDPRFRPDRRDPGAHFSAGLPAVWGNCRCRRQYLGGHSSPQSAEDRVGRRSRTEPTTPRPTARRSRRQRASRARLCAPRATSRRRLPARTRKSRPNITSRTSRMRRWSRLRRLAESSTARLKSGQACKARRPRMIWSPNTWVFRPRTSRSM